ncbi:hypothetical protein FALCPG4_004369 [Fusarium falciforme]
MRASALAEGHVAATPLLGLLGDTKFGQSRPAGGKIMKPDDLTTQERDQMVGLIKAWLAIEYGTSAKTEVPTPESSAKAFLSVIVNEKSGEPRWQWKDSCGQAAPNDVVKFHEGLTLEGWKVRCLKNYDYHEQRLTDNYNRELVMASARQLIIQWAKDGSASNEMPIVHINSCPKLREPQFVAPRIQAYHERFILAMDKAELAIPQKQAQ